MPVAGTYDTYSQIMFIKATPTLAYRVEVPGVAVSVGASLNVGASHMSFRHGGMQFPEPGNTTGLYAQHALKFESDWAPAAAVRGGALVELLDKTVTAGVSYQSKASLTYKGTATIDGMLDYNGRMEFAWPQQIAGGVAVRPFGNLLLGADITWINWADTMGTGLRPIPDKVFVDAALEISPRKTVTSDAANQFAYQPGTTNPNGYSTSLSMSQISLHLGAGVRF